MNILITGSNGFIGRNLKFYLNETSRYELHEFTKENSLSNLEEKINHCDVIVHLAGENRPSNPDDFHKTNYGLTAHIAKLLKEKKKKTNIIFTSTIQVDLDNLYGKSKKNAEKVLLELRNETNHCVSILRIPGVFGKWCKPNYNSVVATFCHNIANDIPIEIIDESREIQLVYIDDLVSQIRSLFEEENDKNIEVKEVHQISVSDLAEKINSFHNQRESLFVGDVGSGFNKLLYTTYLTYLPKAKFQYELTNNMDKRGRFVEFFKNDSIGQFSYFTSNPGVSRGEHYHNTKVEKFLVLQGDARFRFKSIIDDEIHEFFIQDKNHTVVETIPGWAHEIKNVGTNELIVMVWANEIFDKNNPDTFPHEVKK